MKTMKSPKKRRALSISMSLSLALGAGLAVSGCPDPDSGPADAYVPPGVDAAIDSGTSAEADAYVPPGVDGGPSTRPDVGPVDAAVVPPEPTEAEWYREVPDPSRVRYASPAGAGDGSSQSAPMALSRAISEARAGDLIWLLEGDYTASTSSHRFELEADGTAGSPILYRALPGARARLFGGIRISGEYTWLWGLEVTDPDELLTEDPTMVVGTYARGAVLINNVLHDEGYQTSLNSWDFPDQLVYGNIVYHGYHNIYVQNDADHGYRYFVHNISMDARRTPEGQGPFEFHAYAEGGMISGMYLEGNVFTNTTRTGRMLIGARNTSPNDREILRDNFFYSADLQLGFARPVQAEVIGNYLMDSQLVYRFFWGEGEIRYPGIRPIIVRGNTIYQSRGTATHVDLQTSAYTGPDRSDQEPRFRAGDVWDENTYGPSFRGDLAAGGSATFCGGLPTWRTQTESRGNRFDERSTEGPLPTTPHVALLPNAYEAGRAHLVVYNHGGGSSVSVDLSGVFNPGDRYAVHRPMSAFEDPVATGTYEGGSVEIPVSGAFQVYLLRYAD